MSTPTAPLKTSASFLQIFAVILLSIIGLGAFVLSFKSLREVWVGIGADPFTSWVFPIIIDGPILAATVAIVFLSSYDRRFVDKTYAWFVLFLFSGVSIWLNAIHVVLSAERDFDMTTAAIISAAPPVALMLTIHLLAILIHRQKKKAGTTIKATNKEGEVVTGAKKKTDAQLVGIIKRHVSKGRPVTNKDIQRWAGVETPQSASHIMKRLKTDYPEAFILENGSIEQDAIAA